MKKIIFSFVLIFLATTMFCGCQSIAVNSSAPALTSSPYYVEPSSTTPNATPTVEICVSIGIREMTNIEELEKFFIDIRSKKDLDIYNNIATDKYFKLEREVKDSKLQSINIYPRTMCYRYAFTDEIDLYGQNVVAFTWYRGFDNGEEFLRNIWTEGLTYEEVKYKGTLYLYRRTMAPAGKNGEVIEVNQYAIWTHGNDCFDAVFPLSYSKEEFLDYCKAVSKKVD